MAPSTAPAAAHGPLGDFLLAAAGEAAGAPHLQVFHADGTLVATTYAETAAAARRIAGALLAAGARPGDPVALIGDPSPLQIEATFGVWLAGGVLVPLDPQWEPAAHGRALAKAGVRRGLALPARRAHLEQAVQGIAGFSVIDATAAAAAPAAGAPVQALPAVDPEARALILFTSGTTGEPKAAVLRHRALAWNAGALLRGLDVGAGDNLLAVLPLHHVFGLVTSAILPPLRRARVTFPPSLKGPDVARTMRESGVTLIAAVPQLVLGFDRAIQARLAKSSAVARRLVAVLQRVTTLLRGFGINPGRRLFARVHHNIGPSLRLIGSGGAALDPVAARRLWSLGFDLVEAYGMTEAGLVISLDRPARPSFGSVGYPLPGVEVRIDAADAQGIGEIVVRSPSLFDGYLDAPEETAKVLADGELRTGDLGRLDAAGRLWITGRKKEVIVLGSGKNVYPHEVEARLDESPFIKESCVLGLREDGRPGTEKLHAVVVPDLDAFRAAAQPRIEVTLHDAVMRIGDQLPSHHRVTGVTVRSEPLPRTPLGKLKRFQVERDLLAGRAGEARPAAKAAAPVAPPASRYWPAVVAALSRVAGERVTITPDSGIELDLGLDSLARVEALAALEEELGMKLPEGFGADALSAGDLLERVERQAEKGEQDGSGFTALAAAGGGAELDAWPRRLLRPIGLVVVTLLPPLLVGLARLLWKFRVHGREHLPAGAFLVCPNHNSYLDPVVAVMALPLRHRLRFWALGDYDIFSKPLMRAVAWGGHVLRLHAGSGLKATLEAGGAVLRSGSPLLLFPEGMRAPAGERATFRRGAAILARTLGVPIVPAWLQGVDELLPREASFVRLGPRLAVRFGAPIDPHATDAAADPAAALTELLRERVIALGEEERRAAGSA